MSEGATNEYLNARNEWAERYGGYVSAARNWRAMAMGSMALAAVCAFGWIYATGQAEIVPYVVEVDTLGREIAVGRADEAAPADERVIRSMLARWVVNVRSVYRDVTAQMNMLEDAYTMIPANSEAKRQLDAWYRANSPLEREGPVEVQVTSVLMLSEQTWRVEWEESSGELGREYYQANISVMVSPPGDERIAVVNPLGVYIEFFQWGVRL